jgi:hypothetical protein
MCTAAAPILVVPLLSILVSQALSLFFSSTITPSPDARHTKERKKDSNNKAPSRSSSSSKPKINLRKRTRTRRRAMIAQESQGALELTKENRKSSECFLGQATTDHSCKR